VTAVAAQQRFDLVVVGAGVAGTTAALTVRSLRPAWRIALVGTEPPPLYSRVLLPRVIRGEMDAGDTVVHDQSAVADAGIVVVPGAARRLDAEERCVTLSGGRRLGFRKAVIASGGEPMTLPIPGSHLGGVYVLRTIADAVRIREALKHRPWRTVVVGGGLIGLELSAAFAVEGLDVILLVIEQNPLAGPLGPEASAALATHLRASGVDVRCGECVVGFDGGPSVSQVVLASGDRISTSLVGLGVGIRPATQWLEGSGLEVADGVAVDSHLATSHPDIHAAGDVASFFDVVSGHRRRLGNWSNAASQGNHVAGTVTGEGVAFHTTSDYSITVLGVAIHMTGDVTGHNGGTTITVGEPGDCMTTYHHARGTLVGGSILTWRRDRCIVASRNALREAVLARAPVAEFVAKPPRRWPA
jgi:3-phenylpropionate/trans-cinnamate dioxygenase ferredoxin reductase subunit